MTRIKLFILILSVATLACNRVSVTELQEMAYTPVHGIYKKIKDQSGERTIRYLPPVVLSVNEHKMDESFDDSEINESLEKYQGSLQFEYRLYWDVTSGKGDSAYLLRYNSSECFKLLDGGDTIDCAISQIEEYDAIKPYTTFQLAFEKPKEIKQEELLFIVIGSMGMLPADTMVIKTRNISYFEKLKLKL